MTIKSSCFKRDLIVNIGISRGGGNEFLFIQDLQVLYYIVQIVPIMTAIKLI